MDAGQTTPGMRFPPPVAFIVGLAIGFLLQHRFPVALAAPGSPLPRLLGSLLALAAGALALWALLTFRRAHTSVRPDRPSTTLVTHGPFRLTRNPMYLSLSLLHAGIALLANALWPGLMLLPALFAIRYCVIAREERYLLARFGPDYQAYLRTVRRWF
jgi:protein-S-isoprenylcysteine O-methyltransferase Ste14